MKEISMNKVVDSVQQIVTECNYMIEQTIDCEYIDVKLQAQGLREKCDKLKELFDNTPEKEREIRMAKASVENSALTLEYYMYARMKLYEERYKFRQFASKMYQDLRCIFLKSSKEDCVSWGPLVKWALDFNARSQHILFEVDEDDEVMIKRITEKLNEEETK